MKAYIVRIWKDDTGEPRGHVSDPLTQERVRFRNWRELQQILAAGFAMPAEDMNDTNPNQEIHHD
ncbi:MAG: hypothetical protein ACOC9Z_08155 [Chloroflexota bacterium]